jgi:hypothetical protein
MSNLIDRQAAIDAVNSVMVMKGIRSGKSITAEAVDCAKRIIADNIRQLPPIQPKRGRWHYSDGKPATIGRSFGVICDQCGTESEYCTNFCGECGADMRTKETDCDYERAVEQLEHDMLYEPTFNQDDGSM